jgi:type VI secretion system protein ImpA
LKRLAAESNWEELLTAALAAAGAPCGRAWLDVQRYIWRASVNAGYSAIASTVVSSLQALLKEMPDLRHWTLDDDTPTANAETQQWLDEEVVPKPVEVVIAVSVPEAVPEIQPVVAAAAFSMELQTPEEEKEAHVPDAYELAEQFMRQGQVQAAIQLLVRDSAQQPSGRARFQRRMQVAQLCLAAGYDDVAHPMLEQLAREIDQRKLEEWEAGEVLAQPLALLLKCLEKTSNGTVDRAAIFTKLCNIDPTAAINLSR